METTTAPGREVKMDREVRQVIEGLEYEGSIFFTGAELLWKLRFGTHISELDDMPNKPTDTAGIRKLFQLSIQRKDGSPVELTDDEWGFFFQQLGEFTCVFFNQNLSQAANTGEFGRALRGESEINRVGATAGIAATSESVATFPQNLIDMLEGKLGCPIPSLTS